VSGVRKTGSFPNADKDPAQAYELGRHDERIALREAAEELAQDAAWLRTLHAEIPKDDQSLAGLDRIAKRLETLVRAVST
jgi:hypothetical protein